jgi:ketosteroid isomerase-like protein
MMPLLSVMILAAAVATAAVACRPAVDDFNPDEIVALEQAALDRWGKGDPDGYFEIMAADITYFDPTTAKRVDGLDALKQLIAPFRGKIRIERAEIIDPSVQHDDETAVLTFNLVSHGAQLAGGPKSDVGWNSTEVYRRIDGGWKIIHSHWSYTKPELARAGG